MRFTRRARRYVANIGVLLLGFLLWFLFAPLLEASKGQITIYTIERTADGRALAQARERYRVWPQSQSVHREYPNRREYRGCTIEDRKNWRCPSSDGSPVVLENGRLRVGSDVEQVSRWTWYRALLLRR